MEQSFFSPTGKEIGGRVTHVTFGGSLRQRLTAARRKPLGTTLPIQPVNDPEKSDPENRKIKQIMESKVLGGRVEVIFNLDKAGKVTVGNVDYGHDEIRDLISRRLPVDELLAVHKIKEFFDGAVLTRDQVSNIRTYPISQW